MWNLFPPPPMTFGRDQGSSQWSAALGLVLWKATFSKVAEDVWEGVVIILLKQQIEMSQLELLFGGKLIFWVAVRKQQSTS